MSKDSVSEEVKIEIRNRPFAAILVNGKGPYWFLLETGTHTSDLSTEVAQTLGLKREEYPSPSKVRFYVYVVEFSIGKLRWKHVIHEGNETYLNASRKMMGKHVEGMLGYIFLKDLILTINYPEETLVVKAREGLEETRHLSPRELIQLRIQDWEDLKKMRPSSLDQIFVDEHGEQLRDQHEVPMPLVFGDPIAPVFVNGEGPYQFFLDTGASRCIVSPEVAQSLELPRGEMGAGRGLNGNGQERLFPHYSSTVKSLAVGKAECRNLEVSVGDCSQASKRLQCRVDGYIGTNFLKEFNVTIDYPGQTLTLR